MADWRAVDEYVKELSDLQEELTLTRAEVVVQTEAKEQALLEIERLKSGQFTPEEFQNLCHTLPADKVCIFRQGCDDYQVSLFGEEAVRLDIARQLRLALQKTIWDESIDKIATDMAKVLIPNSPCQPPQ